MGETKQGKGTKVMAVVDGSGLPVAISATSATPHESRLVEATIDARFVRAKPKRLIGDKAYDSDGLDRKLKAKGVEMIAPHRENRRKAPTQDGRALRRYERRWKVERLFAWLQSFRHLTTRYERYLQNFLGFIHLGCIVILLRRYL